MWQEFKKGFYIYGIGTLKNAAVLHWSVEYEMNIRFVGLYPALYAYLVGQTVETQIEIQQRWRRLEFVLRETLDLCSVPWCHDQVIRRYDTQADAATANKHC